MRTDNSESKKCGSKTLNMVSFNNLISFVCSIDILRYSQKELISSTIYKCHKKRAFHEIRITRCGIIVMYLFEKRKILRGR